MSRVTSLSFNLEHVVVSNSEGQLFFWGKSDLMGVDTYQLYPVMIKNVGGYFAKEVSCTEKMTVFLSSTMIIRRRICLSVGGFCKNSKEGAMHLHIFH